MDYNRTMRKLQQILIPTALALASCLVIVAQPPQGKGGPGGGGGKGGGKGPGGPTFTVTSPSFADGAEIPRKHSFYGENKLPQFDFAWLTAGNPGAAPATLQTYVVIFHDIENSTAKGPADTLHWSAFNIPASAKGLPEGMGGGDLPDGTRNGPGIRPPAYFGPGAGPGPFHHYVWEFYALDTKLDLPANTTREEIMKGMEGHVIGKAAYVGRFHNVQ
jgi:Raf kinase inhibitor-like YbhB/YbcL family protein